MNRRIATLSLLAAFVLACTGFASVAFAQNSSQARPAYLALPPHSYYNFSPAGSAVAQWNGGFTDLTHQKITFTMIGTDPHNTNVTTTVPVFLVPIKMVYPKNNGNKTFDPNKDKVGNGQTFTKMILGSPIFQSSVDFKQGGIDVGKTQYIDAFQRANFWSVVKKNNKYHVLLGKATVLPEQTIKVSASHGTVITNPVSGQGLVGTYDFNSWDPILQGYMQKLKQIQPNGLALFVTHDIYLTSGNFIIGGYHTATAPQPNGQTYAYTTAVDQQNPVVFAQDVSALSHELGEWMDDPFTDNNVNCQDNSILEVGDPLESNPNFGTFPYKVGNFTYNLQSLVFLGYFGAPRSTSLLKWLSFQNDEKNVCPGQ